MRVELITIGDEVLEGRTVNTNASLLASQLSELGYEIGVQKVISDNVEAIQTVLRKSLERSAFVIATGGLGPTIDDLTKSAAADLFGKKLLLDEALYENLKKRYPDSDALRNQALVPDGAIVIQNRVGSASGLLFLSKTGSLFLLPGPPREMEPMFKEEVLPLITKQLPLKDPFRSLSLSLCQLKELDIDPLLRDISAKHPDAKIGIYPSYGTLQVRFRICKDFERLAIWKKQIIQQFPANCFGDSTIDLAVHRELIARKKTLALAESCTGGAISARLTLHPDASLYLLGSMVVYSNEWKLKFLGVRDKTLQEHGAVSREIAIEMAEGLMHTTGADFTVAVTGIAGPSGGSEIKPVGTVYFAVSEKGKGTDSGKLSCSPNRSSVVEHSVQMALSGLYRKLVFQVPSFS